LASNPTMTTNVTRCHLNRNHDRTMRTKLAKNNRTPFVTRPSHLHWRFRVVIGLHRLGATDMEIYARALSLGNSEGWDLKKAQQFVTFTLCHENAVIQMALEDGLTLESAVLLQNSAQVRCKVCGTNVNAVPCHTCISNSPRGLGVISSDMDDDDWIEAGEPVIQPQPTLAEPGSHQKVEILRKRFERDEFMHHAHDKRLETGYINPWLYRDTVSQKYPGMTPRKAA
jgi:hypothetical protein